MASVVSDLGDSVDCSPPGSSVHGILQARILEWVAMPFSKGSSWGRDWTHHLLHWQVSSLPLAPPGKHISRLTALKEVCLAAAAAALWQLHKRGVTEGPQEGGHFITHKSLVGKGAFIRYTRWDNVLHDKPLAFLREKIEESKQGNH